MNATPIQFTFETAHTERDQLELSKLIQRLETAERELAEQAKRFHDEIADRQKTEAANRELNLKERDALRARVAELEHEIGALFRRFGIPEGDYGALENLLTKLYADRDRLDWIAGRASTDLVHFAVGGWAIIKSTGGDMLHDLNIHDLRQAIDAARAT